MIAERETVTKTRTDEKWRREWGVAPRPVPRLRSEAGEEQRTTARRKGRASASSPSRQPMAHRGPRVLRKARELSWRSPMLAAVLFASFAVSLLCFYIAAYARVTAQGYELSRLKREYKAEALHEDALRAEISRLSLRGTVTQRAAALGLVPGTMENLELGAPPQNAPVTQQTENDGN